MITKELIAKLHRAAPRYTSYPTAVEFRPLDFSTYEEKLQQLSHEKEPLSLYFHIPFCKTMCLYCACSVILNRKPENEERYVNYLMREIDLVTEKLGEKKEVTQLHFGGGTPTKLSISLLEKLYQKIDHSFNIDYSREVAIEIDPRTVVDDEGAKLQLLRRLGFNRVSFGVQDTNPEVQKAVRREQSLEMTIKTFEMAKELGFKGINIDLIYGLPYQTQESFAKTIDDILNLRPCRIALFSYAKVPWLKPHQKAIKESTLPITEEKFAIYAHARRRLIESGYLAIGMDHFALKTDEMAKAYSEKKLQRNFQGYTCRNAEEMVSFGVTAIGCVKNTYIQNVKDLEEYYVKLDHQTLPVGSGRVMSNEDILRKLVIHTLMCDFSLDKRAISQKFGINFESHFASSLRVLSSFEADGLVEETHETILVTPLGELFIRNIAMCFDAYLDSSITPKFSQSI